MVREKKMSCLVSISSDSSKDYAYSLWVVYLCDASECRTNIMSSYKKKSRIRETPTLSTDADRRTDTNLKRLRNFSPKKKKKKKREKNKKEKMKKKKKKI